MAGTTELAPGTTFAGYEIESIAGRGGMGVVYRAMQLRPHRRVALKVVTPELAQDLEFRARFEGEAEVAASIEHPNVVPIYQVGDADGQLFQSQKRADLEIFDRVGGGDSFASGLVYGFLAGKGPQFAVECGAAHGALAMTTPGDTSMATLGEVEKAMKGGGARVDR